MAKSIRKSQPKKHTAKKQNSSARGRQSTDEQRSAKRCFTAGQAWCIRIALIITAPIIFFTILELALLIAGFGSSSRFFIQTDTKGILTTNEKFVRFFHSTSSGVPHPCNISETKPENTLRVFVLGESAAIGTPDPAFGFAAILEFMLEQNFPDKNIEVINSAVRGINTHIIVPIAHQCTQLQPDLFVVYAGNNETCGLYGPENPLCQHPKLIPICQRLRQTRSSQLIQTAINTLDTSKDEVQTMEFFREHRLALEDPRRQAVYNNFKDNIEQICRIAQESGAGLILSTVAGNLKDFPPLGSLHRKDIAEADLRRFESLYSTGSDQLRKKEFSHAIDSFRQAELIDNHFAELHFVLGQCYLATADTEAAQKHFTLARDLDALQFRTDSRQNDIIREVASKFKDHNLILVDSEKILAQTEPTEESILGGELFYDHVHFRFDGDFRLAKTLLPAVTSVLGKNINIAANQQPIIPTQQQCEQRLAFTICDKVDAAQAMVTMMQSAPFTDQYNHQQRLTLAQQQINQIAIDERTIHEVLYAYQTVLAKYPEDWNIRYRFATLLYQLKQYDQATQNIMQVVDQFPEINKFRVCLAHALAQTGQIDQAIEHYKIVLERNPKDEPVKRSLQWAMQQKR